MTKTWEYVSHGGCAFVMEDGQAIIEFLGEDDAPASEGDHARARLAAAAPELLSALKVAMKFLAWDDIDVFQSGADEARAAVAKAGEFK